MAASVTSRSCSIDTAVRSVWLWRPTTRERRPWSDGAASLRSAKPSSTSTGSCGPFGADGPDDSPPADRIGLRPDLHLEHAAIIRSEAADLARPAEMAPRGPLAPGLTRDLSQIDLQPPREPARRIDGETIGRLEIGQGPLNLTRLEQQMTAQEANRRDVRRERERLVQGFDRLCPPTRFEEAQGLRRSGGPLRSEIAFGPFAGSPGGLRHRAGIRIGLPKDLGRALQTPVGDQRL